MKKINEVVETGSVSFYAKVANKNKGTTKDGSEFLSINLADNTGSINGKIWNSNKDIDEFFKLGEVFKIVGEASSYNDKLQVIINVNESREVTDEDAINLDDFYQSAPMDLEVLDLEVRKYINKIDNEIVKNIVVEIFKKHYSNFKLFPAATQNHHAYISGLIFHVYTMLKVADGLLAVYDFVDKDYVYAGIILHDVGKVIELSDFKGPEYTLKGKLVGHINIMVTEIHMAAKELGYLDEEAVYLLEHIVLSHHGRYEWGSPKKPMTPEAEIVHYCDLIDSKMSELKNELEVTDEGDFTKRIMVLDGRSFYKKK